MKNIYAVTFLLFTIGFAQAQIIEFEDPNFKNALVNTNCCTLTDGTTTIENTDVSNE